MIDTNEKEVNPPVRVYRSAKTESHRLIPIPHDKGPINMKFPSRLSAAILFGLALLATNAQQAAADVLYAGTAYTASNYFAKLDGIPGTTGEVDSQTASFYSQVSSSTFTFGTSSIPTFQTYCVDLFQPINSATVETANVSIYSGLSTDGSNFSRNIGAAGWVVDNYGTVLNTLNTSAAWSALYTAAGLTSAQIATIGFNEQNAIVQTAVWATAYGATSASIGGGGTENATLDLVLNALLTAASGKTEGVGFINFPPPNIGNNGSKNQDMLYSVTPEPSSMAIAALGALGFLGYGWKRRQGR